MNKAAKVLTDPRFTPQTFWAWIDGVTGPNSSIGWSNCPKESPIARWLLSWDDIPFVPRVSSYRLFCSATSEEGSAPLPAWAAWFNHEINDGGPTKDVPKDVAYQLLDAVERGAARPLLLDAMAGLKSEAAELTEILRQPGGE